MLKNSNDISSSEDEVQEEKKKPTKKRESKPKRLNVNIPFEVAISEPKYEVKKDKGDKKKQALSFTAPPAKSTKKLSTSLIKEFILPMTRVRSPFLTNVKSSDKEFFATPSCVCGQPMIRKGKMYICPQKCKFQVSIDAFKAFIEYEYINAESAMIDGLILPKCDDCAGCKIVTGGEWLGNHIICFRCYCAKNNLKLILARGTSDDSTISKICSTGIYNIAKLPFQQKDSEGGTTFINTNVEDF